MSNELPADAEQIGAMVFVPNADYPYPFKVNPPPRFWMEEQTGVLADAVDTYMNGESLSTVQLNLIKLYLTQYLERAVLAGDANRPDLLGQISKLRMSREIEEFADNVSEYGAEVF
ncbi:MAG: hypothetical protein H0T53_08990 [Herpetosiphonaceae bacterium]|nr:hypothetical protein [Herpetosiphonaceae bacterium]